MIRFRAQLRRRWQVARYKVVSRSSTEVEIEALRIASVRSLLESMAADDVIPQWVADQVASQIGGNLARTGERLIVRTSPTSVGLPSNQRDERKEKEMAVEALDTLVKQYAPSADVAWEWMRKTYEMGWDWGLHRIGGGTAKAPPGQRAASVALSFSNGAVYVGITIVAGEVRWAWFREDEWGTRGKALVLAGDRNHHPDPIAAIADYSLLGEGAPREKDSLNDVFGGWDD